MYEDSFEELWSNSAQLLQCLDVDTKGGVSKYAKMQQGQLDECGKWCPRMLTALTILDCNDSFLFKEARLKHVDYGEIRVIGMGPNKVQMNRACNVAFVCALLQKMDAGTHPEDLKGNRFWRLLRSPRKVLPPETSTEPPSSAQNSDAYMKGVRQRGDPVDVATLLRFAPLHKGARKRPSSPPWHCLPESQVYEENGEGGYVSRKVPK